MRLPDETYEFIKQEVVHLLESLEINCIPISGFEIAYKLGIKLIPYSAVPEKHHPKLLKVSKDGFFLETLKQEYIFFNDEIMEENFGRGNMTILHEVAHDVLGHTGDKEMEEIEEAEANFFGKYCAAPPPLVHRIKPRSMYDVKDMFQLSTEAASNAYNYYMKWLNYGAKDYLEYEERLLDLFDESA